MEREIKPDAVAKQRRFRACPDCNTGFLAYGRRMRCSACQRAVLARKAASPEAKQKLTAQKAAQAAIRRGELVRQLCEGFIRGGRCNATRAHAHHEDYSKPLEVVWLCPAHHRWRHQEINREQQKAQS